jgi:hypothetical protein
MKKALEILVLGGLIVGLSLSGQPDALEAADSGRTTITKPSLQIGLDIRFDADWISFNGNLSVGGKSEIAGGNTIPRVTREVRLGVLPNLVRQTRKSIALIRAFRTTTICLAREWLGD